MEYNTALTTDELDELALQDAAKVLNEPVLVAESLEAPKEQARIRILKRAMELTGGDRNKSYGSPKPNMACHARLVGEYLNTRYGCTLALDAVDGAMILTLVKVARIAAKQDHDDNYVDGAAYMAIAGECVDA